MPTVLGLRVPSLARLTSRKVLRMSPQEPESPPGVGSLGGGHEILPVSVITVSVLVGVVTVVELFSSYVYSLL